MIDSNPNWDLFVIPMNASACYNWFMSQLQLLRIRLKPGTTSKVIQFVRELGLRNSEVTQAFTREGMQSQSFFLERRDDGDWLYYLARAEDLMQAAIAHEQAGGPLAETGRELMASAWSDIHAPELLCDLVRDAKGIVQDQAPQSGELALEPLDLPSPTLRRKRSATAQSA